MPNTPKGFGAAFGALIHVAAVAVTLLGLALAISVAARAEDIPAAPDASRVGCRL